jgi:excisionase family DNA binding protein
MKYLTTGEVSKRFGVSRPRILVLIKSGRLPAQKAGRDWLIDPAALSHFKNRPQGNYKLSLEEIAEIKRQFTDGAKPVELASTFSVSVRTIYRHIKK